MGCCKFGKDLSVDKFSAINDYYWMEVKKYGLLE